MKAVKLMCDYLGMACNPHPAKIILTEGFPRAEGLVDKVGYNIIENKCLQREAG